MTKMAETESASVASKITAEEAALYDRQIRLWGLEAQNRLKGASVLIVGISGVGAEVAKNLMLAGLKSLTLMDDQNVSGIDLKTNCLITDRAKALHKNRAAAVAMRCQQLNPLVQLKTMALNPKDVLGKVKESIAAEIYDLVCCIDRSVDECLEINKACRQCPKLTLFAMGSVFGWFGYTFSDFGDGFEYACEILNPLPGKLTQAQGDADLIEEATLDEEPEFKKPRLEPGTSKGGGGGGDTISKRADENQPEGGNGMSTKKEREKVIVRKVTSFCSLENVLKAGTAQQTGSHETKRRRARPPYPVGFYLFQITAGFRYQFKRTPEYSTKSDDLRALNREFNDIVGQLGDTKLDLPENFGQSLFEQMPAVCAIVGGVLGQEIIKAVSRKDEPLNNMFFYNPFDSTGSLAKIPRR